MQPLIDDNKRHNGTFNNFKNKHKSRKYYCSAKSLCIIFTILLTVAIVAIGYFGSFTKQLNNNNPARNFFEKPDNTLAYPSTVEWKDEKRKPPPKPGSKLAPGENTDDIYGTTDTSDTSDTSNPSDPSSSSYGTVWQNAPPGTATSGTTVDGVTYGGDDVTSISYPGDFEPVTDGEVPFDAQQEPQQEAPTQPQQPPHSQPSQVSQPSQPSEDTHSRYPNGIYPTTVDAYYDRKRVITPSNPKDASTYYKSNGADDLIAMMPYLVAETCEASTTQCGFKQYSGYVLANNNAEIHYWFVEAEEDPEDKPVLFWTNGGPGCSGLDGLLTEHGPWRVTDDLQIHYNPYSWNTEVNMVYLEQPYGVGFSAVAEGEQEVNGDVNAADDMDAVVRNWLTKFPFYKNNKIYLSSESWGGHYVPITAYVILQNNDSGYMPQINFGGFFLGNPYTDFYENAYGFVGGVYGHGLMKSAAWDQWRSECWGNENAIDNDATCSVIYSQAYISAYNSNVYALDWPQCYDDEDWEKDFIHRPSPSFWRFYDYKDAHIHHAARGFMEILLAHHDYQSLKMSLERTELQQLHDKIAQKLALQQDDYYGYGYGYSSPQQGQIPQQPQQPQQGGYSAGQQSQPGQQKPEDGTSYGGMPMSGGGAAGQQQQPQQPSQGGQQPQQPAQGMPQQPSQGQMGQSQQGQQGASTGQQTGTAQRSKPKVPNGMEHDRPNHNVGNKAVAGSQAERDEELAREQEALEKEREEQAKSAAAADDGANVQYGDEYLPCIEYDMADYLNLGAVQSALHVKPTEWQMCNDNIWNEWPESDYDTKVEAFYAEIIDKYLVQKELTLSVYSGDDDSVCGLQGTQYWLDRWKYQVNENVDWQQWEDDDGELGGFYSQYMSSDGSDVALHFLTVRTAGHMVPTTEPKRALTILKKFLYQFNKDN